MNDLLDIKYTLTALINENTLLRKRFDALEKENIMLRERLSRYEHPKDSHNSSLPPSKNPIGKKPIKLREPSGLKSGGQSGHKGTTLKMQNPDKIEELRPNYCTSCGGDLRDVISEVSEIRQQIDIPPEQPVVTEYRQMQKVCRCSHINYGTFPDGINASISYGEAYSRWSHILMYVMIYPIAG